MENQSLYLEDVHAWSQQQANLLRELARAALPLPNQLDLENIVEEIESLGSEWRYAAESNLERALDHLIKLALAPGDNAAGHWLTETNAFLRNARKRYRPSMRQLIALETIWADAAKTARDEARLLDAAVPALPAECPFDLAALLDPNADPRALAARLRAALPPEAAP